MKYSDQSYHLRIELDTQNFELSPGEIKQLERGLDPLRRPVEKFPVANLYITIEFHPRSNDYRVKTALRLPGRGLTTGDLEKEYYPAFERCVRKLVHKVIAYEGRLEDAEARHKHEKGTRHDVIPDSSVDAGALTEAVEEADYTKFHELMLPYEEPVRKRIGRWIQRFPKLQNKQLDEVFTLADVVEEVFLNAFERFEQRPREVPLGKWLENLIDPSLKLISNDLDGELQNISFARSARDTE